MKTAQKLFISILLLLSMSSQILCAEASTELKPLLENYFSAMSKYASTRNSEDEEEKIQAEELAERSKLKITTYFRENYFQNEFREEMAKFNRAAYEKDLELLHNYEKQYPTFVTELSIALQNDWEEFYLDIFEIEQEKQNEELRAPIRNSLYFASFAAGLSSAASGLYFAAFKTAFPKVVTKVVTEGGKQVVAPNNTGLLLSGAASATTLSAASLKLGYRGKPATSIKEIPIPPAQKIKLSSEPVYLSQSEITSNKFHTEVIASLATIAATSATPWVMAVLLSSRMASLGISSIPTPINLLASILVGWGISTAVTEVCDYIDERAYTKELLTSIDTFETALQENSEYKILSASMDLIRKTQRLAAFYRYQIMSGSHHPKKSDRILKYRMLDLMDVTCTDGEGCPTDELDAFRWRWKSNAELSQKEIERRQTEARRTLEKLSAQGMKRYFERLIKKEEVAPEIEKKNPLAEVPFSRLKKSKQIHKLGEDFLAQYEKDLTDSNLHPTTKNFRNYLRSSKRVNQHQLAQHLNGLRILSDDPDELLLQVAGLIRSSNKKFLNQFARKLETSTERDPLLAFSVINEGEMR